MKKMIYIENKPLELLQSCKIELLDGIPKTDQMDLLMGFLATESVWMAEQIKKNKAEFYWSFGYIKYIRKNHIKRMTAEEKMLYYHADVNLEEMRSISRKLEKLHKEHQFMGIRKAKGILERSMQLFNGCKHYSVNYRVTVLHNIIKYLKAISPISIPYIRYFLCKFKKCFT